MANDAVALDDVVCTRRAASTKGVLAQVTCTQSHEYGSVARQQHDTQISKCAHVCARPRADTRSYVGCRRYRRQCIQALPCAAAECRNRQCKSIDYTTTVHMT
jgi:hypothetical protein